MKAESQECKVGYKFERQKSQANGEVIIANCYIELTIYHGMFKIFKYFNSFITTILRGRYYYPYFTKETVAQRI